MASGGKLSVQHHNVNCGTRETTASWETKGEYLLKHLIVEYGGGAVMLWADSPLREPQRGIVTVHNA